jgi:hypothetical protein
VRRRLRENGLGVFFLGIFAATLVAQALVGHADFNHRQVAHHDDPVSLGRYVLSSDFGTDVLRSSRSTCASAARRNPSRSARRTTTPRASPAETQGQEI